MPPRSLFSWAHPKPSVLSQLWPVVQWPLAASKLPVALVPLVAIWALRLRLLALLVFHFEAFASLLCWGWPTPGKERTNRTTVHASGEPLRCMKILQRAQARNCLSLFLSLSSPLCCTLFYLCPIMQYYYPSVACLDSSLFRAFSPLLQCPLAALVVA